MATINATIFKQALQARRIVWRKHALVRMLERGISRDDITRVLLGNDPIELYVDDKPFPSALFFGTIQGRVIHVVAALDDVSREVHVISAYEPDQKHFEANKRIRRRK